MHPTQTPARRGQLYMADFGSEVGSEQSGVRPIVILQNNTANRFCPTLTVAPLTTKLKKIRQLSHVLVLRGNGLESDSKDDVPIESDFYCQDTFDLFSLEREGANRCGRQFLHGDGYEWGAAFLAAFAEHDNIDEVELDCQLERFTVRSWDLQTLADLGAHFQEICEDEEEFKNLVFKTLA